MKADVPRSTSRIGAAILLAAAVLLAAIPGIVIVLVFWLDDTSLNELSKDLWARVPFFSRLFWPQCLLPILLAMAGLILLFLLRRCDPPAWPVGPPPTRGRRPSARGRSGRVIVVFSFAGLLVILLRIALQGRLPGSELLIVFAAYVAGRFLEEVSRKALLRLWRRKAPVTLLLFILQICLLVAFAGVSSGQRASWILFVLPAAATLFALRSRLQIPVWGWIVPLAIFVRCIGLNSWLYTLIGDEYSLWGKAREIVQTHSLAQIGNQLLLMDGGVAGTPYVDSVVQAVGMAAAGTANFGWKVSTIYLSALAIPFFFSFVRTFAGHRVAIFASFFFACSEYLMSFSKIGYINLLALFTMALVLSASAWAVRTRRPFAFTALGFAMGSCFYVYPAALYVLPLPILMLLLYDPPSTRRALLRWTALAAAVLLATFPMLLQPDFYITKAPGFFLSSVVPRTPAETAFHYARNVMYSGLSYLWKPDPSHYVGVGYQDPLSTLLIGLGIAVLLRRLTRDRFAVFAVVGWVFLLALTASHAMAYPPTTRMFLLLPVLCLFAAIGFSWLADQCRRAGLSYGGMGVLSAVMLLGVLALNLVDAYRISPRKMVNYQEVGALFNRIAQRAKALSREEPVQIVLVSRRPVVDYGFETFREVYPLPQISDIELVADELPLDAALTLSDPKMIVMIRPEIPESLRPRIEAVIRLAGKHPCPAMNLAGEVKLIEWQSLELPRLCESASTP